MTRAQSFEYLNAEHRALTDKFSALMHSFADAFLDGDLAVLAVHRQRLNDFRADLANHTIAVEWTRQPPAPGMWPSKSPAVEEIRNRKQRQRTGRRSNSR